MARQESAVRLGSDTDVSLAPQQAPPSPTAIGIVPPPMPTAFGTVPPTSTPTGKELPELDTHVEHYTRAGKGLFRLQFYNSTAGVPELKGWQPRDTRLVPVAGTNALRPKRMPFPVQIAASSAGLTTPVAGTPVLAALTSEGNVTLTLGMRAVTPYVGGHVRGDSVTYARVAPSQTRPRPPASDLSLRATISGLDVRVVLHSVRERGPFALTFAGATGMQLVPDPGGSIEVTQAYSYYDSTGTATATYTRPEYLIQPPNSA